MSTHEFLQWRAVTPHVTYGLPHPCLNTQTPIDLLDLATTPATDLLGYGTHDTGYTLLTWKELAAWFDTTHQTTWPAGPHATSPLDACTLAALERLAKDHQWTPLLQSLRTLRDEANDETHAVRALVVAYTQAPLRERLSVDNVLWAWLYLGMAMRGWTAEPPSEVDGLAKTALYIHTPFPLHDTAVEPGDTLDLRIHRWAHLLHDALDACTSAWRTRLTTARLYLFNDRQFRPAHDRDQGVTLEDRLRTLTRPDNVHACVRLSSNWLCYSAAYYFTQLDIPLPFALCDLVRIA